VYTAGSPQINSPPTTTSVTRGSLLRLTCLMIGRPTPTVTWSLNNVTISPSRRITVRWGSLIYLLTHVLPKCLKIFNDSFSENFHKFFVLAKFCEISHLWLAVTCRDGGMELLVSDTTILDAGYYQCHGRNKFGTASSTPVAVSVNGLFSHRSSLSRNRERKFSENITLNDTRNLFFKLQSVFW